jgi:hypothetical protein
MQHDHVVAKQFNTRLRRLRAGDPVSQTDDLSPHTFADLKAGKFIAAKAEPQPPARASQRAGSRSAGD